VFGNGDLDGDDLDDAVDPCVAVSQNELNGRTDTDEDGVADPCDPEPRKPGNCLVLFDSFDSAQLSPHWQLDGVDSELTGDDLWIHYTDEAHLFLDTALTIQSVYTEVYVQNGANSVADDHQMQLFVDLQRDPTASGRACSIQGDTDTSRLAIVDVSHGSSMSTSTAPMGNVPFAAGSTIDFLEWTASGCRAEVDDGADSGSASVPVAPPKGGQFGIRILGAGLQLKVIAAYGRGCTE